MVYDSAHEQIVLFGGGVPVPDVNYPVDSNDTWTWQDLNWTPTSQQNFPEARAGVGMAFDAAHTQVVLFGGGGIPWPGGFSGAINNTWIWSIAGATPPIISAVITNSSFGSSSTVSPGSWVEIHGCGFSGSKYEQREPPDPIPAEPWRTWTQGDFSGNNAPVSLDGIQAAIGGKPTYIEYISPYQINAQLPLDLSAGSLDLTVTNVNGTSSPVRVTVTNAPGFLAPSSWMIYGNQYVYATTADGATPLGPTYLGNRPAKPGETIILYGIGFGPVTPSIDAGQIVTQLNQLVDPFAIYFGGIQAEALYSGLAPGFVGLYQFDVIVPPVPDDDMTPVTFTLKGVSSAQTLYTAVHQ